MEANRELEKFMDRKNKEARGEIIFNASNEYDDELLIPSLPKSINQEIPINRRLTNTITFARIILNISFVIPILLSAIFLFSYIFLVFLPAGFMFIKRLFILVSSFL